MTDGIENPLRRHVPALDGLRGLAILWVMLFHMRLIWPVGALAEMWDGFAALGGLGVDIFFVLSGFLITSILLETKDKGRYFRNFYARRVLRIFPLYYAVVFLSLVVLVHIPQLDNAKLQLARRDAVWYWLHLSNFAIARRGAFSNGILDVSWSLAIEEQFYLVWPLLVFICRPRTLGGICAGLIALSCISRMVLTARGVSPVAVYTLTFCRLDGLSIGALTAICMRTLAPDRLRRALPVVLAGAVVLVGLMLAPIGPLIDNLVHVGLNQAGIQLLASCAIIATLTSAASPVATALSAAPLRTLGRFSYAMYLFHYPLMAALRDGLRVRTRMPLVLGSSLPSQLAFDLFAILLTLLFAFMSWHAYEKWFLKLKRYF